MKTKVIGSVHRAGLAILFNDMGHLAEEIQLSMLSPSVEIVGKRETGFSARFSFVLDSEVDLTLEQIQSEFPTFFFDVHY